MLNTIKTSLFFLGFFMLLGAGDATAQSNLSKNASLVNARVRSLNSTTYVREIIFVDFSKAAPEPVIGWDQDVFGDEGKDNDQVAGDGVYTSKNKYSHSAAVPYQSGKPVRSVIDGPVVDGQFLYSSDLDKYIGENQVQYRGGPTGHIEIELVRCMCPSECTCYACEWGITNWCLALTKVVIKGSW